MLYALLSKACGRTRWAVARIATGLPAASRSMATWPKDMCGEYGLLQRTATRAEASVVALTSVEVLALPKRHFDTLLGSERTLHLIRHRYEARYPPEEALVKRDLDRVREANKQISWERIGKSYSQTNIRGVLTALARTGEFDEEAME